MNKKDGTRLPVALYLILLKYTDEKHIITMNGPGGIIERLQAYGIEAERKTIYAARDILKEFGVQIHQVRMHSEQGYYMEHLFSPAEALVLLDTIAESSSLSVQESGELHQKVSSLMSEYQNRNLPEIFLSPSKTDNRQVLKNIEILMDAISSHRSIRFLYYDLTVTDHARTEKRYRKSSTAYVTDPYGITSGNGRFYCICCSADHNTPAYYRIDKMEKLTISDHVFKPVSFDIHEYVRRSIQMYSGHAQTVKARFSRKIAANVFDEFGHDRRSIIITKVTSDTFEAAIRTTVTPTVTGWFLQFYQDAVILEPQTFRDSLLHIAKTIERNYNTEKQEAHHEQ